MQSSQEPVAVWEVDGPVTAMRLAQDQRRVLLYLGTGRNAASQVRASLRATTRDNTLWQWEVDPQRVVHKLREFAPPPAQALHPPPTAPSPRTRCGRLLRKRRSTDPFANGLGGCAPTPTPDSHP